jgi:microcystin-dependent protein
MALLHYKWSRTAASNATADSSVNWAEGQAPSSVNDSARALMASAAGFRDDIAGAIATGGSSTAYTVTSYQVFDSLANMSGHVIAFTPHTTNGATVTLNVDGLGAKPLRSAPSVELPAGVLVQGTPYTALYNNSDAAWYLHNFFVNPYAVPVGGFLDYVGTTAPNSAFVFPYGQAVSRTTYSVLFTMVSTTFGVGDGSTTFNLPDLRGRVVAGKDDMGGSSANRLTNADDGLNGDTLGATGGGETQTLVTGNLPAYTPAGSVSITGLAQKTRQFSPSGFTSSEDTSLSTGSNTGNLVNPNGQPFVSGTATFTGTAQGGTSTAFGIIQPTIILNKIMRII